MLVRTRLRPFTLRAPSGSRLHGLLQRPGGRGRWPVVVMVPGAMGAGRMMAASQSAARLARAGVVVVGFNAEGRSNGRLWDLRSGGTPDLNGPRDQDGLAAVIRHVRGLRCVEPDNLGLYTISFGLAVATGCIARHPDLSVRYLIDEEGPADCYSAMLQAWSLADSEGRSWPARALSLLGHPCPTEPHSPAAAFWHPREPQRTIGAHRGRYLRLQAHFDHVQPPQRPEHGDRFHHPPVWWRNKHAIQMANAAVSANVPWVRVNLPAQKNPVNATWSMADPPAYLSGTMKDHPSILEDAVLEMVQAAAIV